MSRAPEGMASPPPEIFREWAYLVCERLGNSNGVTLAREADRARAVFEADRAIERLHGLQCDHGWIIKPDELAKVN